MPLFVFSLLDCVCHSAAGVHIRVGYQQARAWGVAHINNFGQTFATGVGIQHVINSVVASTTNCVTFSGNGGTTALSQVDTKHNDQGHTEGAWVKRAGVLRLLCCVLVDCLVL